MKSPVPILDMLGEWQSLNPDLEQVKNVLKAMGEPHRGYGHVLVGGTNGKGTVSLNLANGLPGKIGLFLSPHVDNVRERITIGGQWVPDDVWRGAYDAISNRAGDPKLSFFEWLLVLAVVIFSMENVDGAVFEIGLGSKWDAANALDPGFSILTNVSLDHMEILGDTVEKIALKKIEIARKNKPLFYPQDLNRINSVKRRLTEIGCIPIPHSTTAGFNGNIEIVNKVLSYLGLSKVETPRWPPGRREILRREPPLLMDGAHNRAGWEALAIWTKEVVRERINVLVGLSGKRDPRTLIECLSPVAREFHVWHFDPERMVDAGAWPVDVASVTEEGFERLLHGPLLVCGSLYMVGKFRYWLRESYGILSRESDIP